MKILMGVHHFPPTYIAGGEKDAVRIAKGLQNRGHEIRIVTVESVHSGPPNGVGFEESVYECLPVRRLSFNLKNVPDAFRFEYDNPWIGDHFAGLFREDPPDVFLLVSGYLLTGSVIRAAKAAGVPVLLYVTDLWFFCRRVMMVKSNGELSTFPISDVGCAQCFGEEKRRFRWLGKWFPGLMKRYWSHQHGLIDQFRQRRESLAADLQRVDRLVCLSQFSANIFIQNGVDPRLICLSRQGLVSLQDTGEQPVRYPGRKPFHLGYMGQIARHKGVHRVIEAIRSLPELEICFSVYGDPTAFPDYQRELTHLAGDDPRIQFKGAYRDAEGMRAAYREQDAVIVPSINYENSPNSILEGFSAGIPVLTSNLGGMAELVSDERDGLLFAPDDSADLARTLQRIIQEEGLYSMLTSGVRPPRRVEQQVDEIEAELLAITVKKRLDGGGA